MFAGKHICKSDTLMANLYANYKNEDGFLYLHYGEESVFG